MDIKEKKLLKYSYDLKGKRFNVSAYYKIAHLPRSSVYDVLNRLIDKGLMEKKHIGNYIINSKGIEKIKGYEIKYNLIEKKYMQKLTPQQREVFELLEKEFRKQRKKNKNLKRDYKFALRKLERYKKCLFCGYSKVIHLHHIKRGVDVIYNIIPLCPNCHYEVHNFGYSSNNINIIKEFIIIDIIEEIKSYNKKVKFR